MVAIEPQFPFFMSEAFLVLSFVLGFGFLKKIVKKAVKIGGGALNFIPGGSAVKSAIRGVKDGFSAIIKEIKGQPSQPSPGQPLTFSEVNQSQTGIPFLGNVSPQNLILFSLLGLGAWFVLKKKR